jgi:hypothetical protein
MEKSMQPTHSFAQLVADLIGETAAREVPPTGDDYYLTVKGRPVQLQYLPKQEHVVVSTAVFVSQDGDDVHEDLIADFNAHHLRHGGYCLLVDEETQGLYVALRQPLRLLDADRLAAVVTDLAMRAFSCTSWYMKESHRRQMALLEDAVLAANGAAANQRSAS